MDISVECVEGNVFIEYDSDCEHCRNLEPYSIMWCDGGTWWCLDCARMMDEFNLTEKEIEILKEMSRKKKIEYYKDKIKGLEKL